MPARSSAALAHVFDISRGPGPRCAKDHDRIKAGVQSFGFLSVKGGCGATTLACHVAAELGRQQPVLLVDLDLNAGTVGFTMKARKESSILEAVEGLDSDRWDASDCRAVSGVDVLWSPSGRASRSEVAADEIGRLLRAARLRYSWTLVDMGRGLSYSKAAISGALDEVCLVCTLDVPALYQAQRIVQALIAGGREKHRIRLILNRCPRRLDITRSELESMLGLPIFHMIPNDYPALYEAYAEGRLLTSECDLVDHMGELAFKLAGTGR